MYSGSLSLSCPTQPMVLTAMVRSYPALLICEPLVTHDGIWEPPACLGHKHVAWCWFGVRGTSTLPWHGRGTCQPRQLQHVKASDGRLLTRAPLGRRLSQTLPEGMNAHYVSNSRRCLSWLSPRGQDDPRTLQAALHGEVASGLLETTAEQGNSTFSADAKGSSDGCDSCWEEATLQRGGRASLAFPLPLPSFCTMFWLSLKKLRRDM